MANLHGLYATLMDAIFDIHNKQIAQLRNDQAVQNDLANKRIEGLLKAENKSIGPGFITRPPK
jgi:hypothetical protein